MASSTSQVVEDVEVTQEYDSQWRSIDPISKRSIVVKEIPTTIDLAGFSFDPLSTDLSHLNTAWSTGGSTSLYMIQLSINDGAIINALESEYDIEVLERQSTGVYISRIYDQSLIDGISANEHVRWIGAYEPYMRTTNDALGAHLIQVTLTSDIESSGVPEITVQLIQNGATSAWCSVDMCEAVFEHGLQSNQLRMIATHDDVFFIERAYDLSLHNNLAATEVGAVAVRATNSLGLDGSGETIAVMDTCLLYTSPSPRDVEESRMPSSA